jgi:hypothetical protein
MEALVRACQHVEVAGTIAAGRFQQQMLRYTIACSRGCIRKDLEDQDQAPAARFMDAACDSQLQSCRPLSVYHVGFRWI